jgi:hypothetical protein
MVEINRDGKTWTVERLEGARMLQSPIGDCNSWHFGVAPEVVDTILPDAQPLPDMFDRTYTDQISEWVERNNPGCKALWLGWDGDSTITLQREPIVAQPGAITRGVAVVAFDRWSDEAVKAAEEDTAAYWNGGVWQVTDEDGNGCIALALTEEDAVNIVATH